MCPNNPHYLQWHRRPLLVIGSGEHYGAVLNEEFDYRKYLATLATDGLNHTRLFTGAAYVEPAGVFGIARNTLAPEGRHYLAPWVRSTEPGYAGGGNKFDLERWEPTYFERLREFVATAARENVIVEVNLFCPFYGDEQWRLSPFHPDNNVNGVGKGVARTNVYTLDRSGDLLGYQERFVRRAVAELRDLDNLYFEICNEPYFGGVTADWQAHIGAIITDAQAGHPNPKLISENIANYSATVPQPHAHVSLYNFHYATPPDTVPLNWRLHLPMGDNETGFRGTNDAPYRVEAWEFILAGGALFSHLDYSFTVGHEDGTFVYPASQPGGGNPGLRRQFRILRDFMAGFDLTGVMPVNDILTGGIPPSHIARALGEPDREFAVYLRPRRVSQFSVRWTGFLDAPATADYTLYGTATDGIRVWIDDRLTLDRWGVQSETEGSARVSLERGPHRLKVEYFYNEGQASAKLDWSRPDSPRQPIPAEALRLPDDSGPGLRGEYFIGRDLKEPWRQRVDTSIHFDWDSQSPFPSTVESQPLRLEVTVPTGNWQATWISPLTGSILKQFDLHHNEGALVVEAPLFRDDIALKLVRR